MALLVAFLLAMQGPSIPDLVEKLRADQADRRDEAARELKRLGTAAVPDLERAAKDPDLDFSSRARDLLHQIRSQDQLRQFQQTLESSASLALDLRVRADYTIGGVPNSMPCTVSIYLAERNRAFVRVRMLGANAHNVWVLSSDGSALHLKLPQQAWKTLPVPAELNRRILSLIANGVLQSPIDFFFQVTEAATAEHFKVPYAIDAVRLLRESETALELAFRVSDGKNSYDLRLTLHPKTHELVSLVSTTQVKTDRYVAETTVERGELGGAIAADRFKAPAPGETEEDKIDQTFLAIRMFREKLDAYEDDTGSVPTQEQGLEALLAQPTREPVPKGWKGPYLKEGTSLQDAWGRPFELRVRTVRKNLRCDVISAGPDGKMGTDDDLRR